MRVHTVTCAGARAVLFGRMPHRSHSVLNHGDAIGMAIEVDNNPCSHPLTPACVFGAV